jgi:predicted hydrocarbon binding protein
MPTTVNPRIPLSLLEAVRRIDTPEEDPDAEYVQELRNKRLGLSDTVYQQIRRYTDAAKRGQMIPYSEATGLGTLIARRPDAKTLFVSAGKIFANDVYNLISSGRRQIIRHVPHVFARRLALSNMRQVARRFFGGSVSGDSDGVTLSITDSVTAGVDADGCVYYAAALRELMHLLVGADENVEHTRCIERGDRECAWRASWTSARSQAA